MTALWAGGEKVLLNDTNGRADPVGQDHCPLHVAYVLLFVL